MRRVLVAGGSGGIGRAVVQRFDKAGDGIVFSYASDAAAADETSRSCATAHSVHSDLTAPQAAEHLVETTHNRLGGLDVAVNCVGVYPHAPLLETSKAMLGEVMRVNFLAAYRLIQVAGSALAQAGAGAIVNVTSINAFSADAGLSAYDASKAALAQATRTAALELGPMGVRVNAVAPGLVDDPLLETAAPKRRTAFLTHAPLRKLVTPEDVAEAVFFLASSGAAAITGETLIVDAGVTLAGYAANS